MTFKEKYDSETIWHRKVLIVELFHLAQKNTHRRSTDKKWTQRDTARVLGVSVGLISENLKLAKAIHKNDSILSCETRQEALEKI
jgi:hypothetical protein